MRFCRLSCLVVLSVLAAVSCRQGRPQPVVADAEPELPSASFEPGSQVPEESLAHWGLDTFFVCKPLDDEVFARMDGVSYKQGCPVRRDELRYLKVLHKDASGRTISGEIVVNASVADDVLEIFKGLYLASYPIERMRLVDDYGGDDAASMADNNTSGFNCRSKSRMVALSKHAYGLAIDINPLYNPYVRWREGASTIIEPAQGAPYVDRAADFGYKIVKGDLCWQLFTSHGFHWGGSWLSAHDYQHFEK